MDQSGQDAALAPGPARLRVSDIAIGTVAILLCLPAILGAVGSILPTIIKPANAWPVASFGERLFVEVFTWSVVLALASPYSTIAAVPFAVWTAKRTGLSSTFARIVCGLLVAAAAMCIGTLIWLRR